MTKEHQMQVLYDEFLRTSGQTKKEFCQKQEVSLSKFKYWERKFSSGTKPKNNFVAIETKPAETQTAAQLVLEYPNGIKISTTAGNLSLIGQLLSLV